MKVNKKNTGFGKGIVIKRNTKFAERRESRDVWARLFIWVNYLGWAGIMIFLLVFHRAQPEFETVFDRFYHLNLRTYWDTSFIRYLMYTVGLGFAVSTAGLCLAMFRARRKTDPNKPIIILGALYFILIVLCWIFL